MSYRALFSHQTEAFASPALRKITIEVAKVNGVNLGQGVCQLPAPEFLIEAAHDAAKEQINRYTNPRGLLSLRQALAKKLAHYNGITELDPDTEILVTCGATGAFEGVCAALLNPGDEVVIFEPTYPYHIQALKRYGANIRYVPLSGPGWTFDEQELAAAFSERTKFILVNTPGNPTGKIFTREELEVIAKIVKPYAALVVTDEIYEYMAFDGAKHLSPAALPSFKGKTITIGGYSKTFSITGWRIGYVVAPPEIAETLTAVLDAVYVCAPAPLQEATARSLNHFGDDFYQALNAKYEKKRNFFTDGLRSIGLNPVLPQGAYYLICRFDEFMPGVSSWQFVEKMIATAGVGAVPADDFVRAPEHAPWIRFCLAVEDDVLVDALTRLQSLSS